HPALPAPLIRTRALDQPQILYRRIVVLHYRLHRHSRRVQVEDVKRRGLCIMRIERRNRLIVVHSAVVSVFPKTHEPHMRLTVGLEHARINSRREPVTLAPFARGMVASLMRAASTDRLQLPKMSIDAQNREARILAAIRSMDRHELKLHPRRKHLPV